MHMHRFSRWAAGTKAAVVFGVASAVIGGLVAGPVAAQEQKLPEGSTVSLVVAYAPGGSTDLMARTISDPLSQALGNPVIVVNRPGGGTAVGTLSVIEAEPNGQTLLYGTNATLLSQVISGNEQYDPLEDLAPVGLVATQSLGVIVHPSVGVDSIEELVAYAKENPGELNFASSGNASLQHLAGEMLMSVADIDMVHIPYTGAGPALTDLLAGRADLMITSILGVQDHLESGKLKLIATTGPKRAKAFPDVPTVAEAGYPDYSATSFQAIFAPKGTPEPIVGQINEALRTAATDQLAATILERGLELEISSPEELTAYLRQQAEVYGNIVSDVGISAQ